MQKQQPLDARIALEVVEDLTLIPHGPRSDKQLQACARALIILCRGTDRRSPEQQARELIDKPP